jgi:hypothetical protein
MKEKTMLLLAVMLVMLATLGAKAYADEMLGGEPKEFHAAIITMGKHTVILTSTIIVDEKARRQPMELVVTNDTKHKHGFAIDKLNVKEVLKPNETKTIKISVTDLDSLGGSEQSAYRIYDPLDHKTVTGQLYVRR